MMADKINTEVAQASPVAAPAKQKWSLKKKLLVALGVFIAVIVVLVLIANQATQGVVNESNKLLNAIQANDAKTAYAELSTEAKATISEDDFKATIKQIAPILNTEEKMTDKSVSAETGKASTGRVVYEIKGKDGVMYNFTVELVKQNDVWKVLSFDSSKQ